ncbi:MAG: HipA domain-containing protein [Oligoflexales bacterium]|nr:HipA domain-containing protein [Oligoflexales bacterium]
MKTFKDAFVWVWLPGKLDPIVAGKLTRNGSFILFNYGRSYLQNHEAIPLFDEELPLKPGIIEPLKGLSIAGCIRDASPDAWGRRAIIYLKFGIKGAYTETAMLDELTYLLESNSDRIGGLDFQLSATDYEPRFNDNGNLEELLESAQRMEKGIPLSPNLALALQHGTSIGGARPKASLDAENRKYLAKFSLHSDIYNVVKAEFAAMTLARLVGLNVASVSLTKALGKDVLLVERFDRVRSEGGWQRKIMVSALTMQILDEMLARYASYQRLAEIIRQKFSDPIPTLRELFGRMVFNVLCGNTDDHARNHAAFWNGRELALTPAFDICPQMRVVGGETSQAMLICDQDRRSRVMTCLDAAPAFLLTREEACGIISHQINVMEDNWSGVCEMAELSKMEENMLWKNLFLNPFVLQGFED